MTAWLLAIGRMLGLGSIAGIRPSLTLVVIGVVGYFDWGVEANQSFAWLGWGWVIGIFVVLAILESTFDKIPKLDRLQDRLIMPYRLVIGGVAGAATMPFGWQGMVAGAAVGAGAAWFAQYTKHLSRPKSVPSEAVVALISAAEDIGAFLSSALVLAVPYFGYACVGFTGFVYWRIRDRRRAKYRRMRRAAPRREAGTGAATGAPRGGGAANGAPGADVLPSFGDAVEDAASRPAAPDGDGVGAGHDGRGPELASRGPELSPRGPELSPPAAGELADVSVREPEAPVVDVERGDDAG